MAERAPPPGLLSPSVPGWIRRMAKLNVWLYRVSGGWLGGRFWTPTTPFPGVRVCLLTTTGRKSGEKRTAPLLFLEDGADIVLVASQGGLPKDPLWYQNLRAQPDVEIELGRRHIPMRARTASSEERAALWPRLVAMYPDFARYQSWTDRVIPVVVCSPR